MVDVTGFMKFRYAFSWVFSHFQQIGPKEEKYPVCLSVYTDWTIKGDVVCEK